MFPDVEIENWFSNSIHIVVYFTWRQSSVNSRMQYKMVRIQMYHNNQDSTALLVVCVVHSYIKWNMYSLLHFIHSNKFQTNQPQAYMLNTSAILVCLEYTHSYMEMVAIVTTVHISTLYCNSYDFPNVTSPLIQSVLLLNILNSSPLSFSLKK